MASQPRPQYRIDLRPYRILYFPFLLPVAFLLALFNKISPVPFKIYLMRVERVGHMASNPEQFLCELEHGMHPKEFRVFVHRDRPSNAALLELIKRVLPVKQCFLPLFDVCYKFGGLGVVSLYMYKSHGNDPRDLTSTCPVHYSFSEEEASEAEKQCRELGIDPAVPFVPVLGRDSAYLTKIGEPTDVINYRNVDINTFIPAMEYLGERFKVVRMGSVAKDRLKTSHPNIIDYSFSGKRTELLDVYLPAKCHFFLTCGTGIDAITSVNFRLPVLFVNYVPPKFMNYSKPKTLYILKKYWHTKEERYLSLRELLTEGAGDVFTPRELDPMGIVIHDNTPEEILDATKEMTQRLDGSWEETQEDEELQSRFRSILNEYYPESACAGRIGAKFLRENPFWLE